MRLTLIAVAAACLLVFLEGCSTTVPVARKFPEMPSKLLEKCPNLEKLKDEAKLSDVAKIVTNNYSQYYECAVKHDAMVEWYHVQKQLFESVK